THSEAGAMCPTRPDGSAGYSRPRRQRGSLPTGVARALATLSLIRFNMSASVLTKDLSTSKSAASFCQCGHGSVVAAKLCVGEQLRLRHRYPFPLLRIIFGGIRCPGSCARLGGKLHSLLPNLVRATVLATGELLDEIVADAVQR